jgi:hypothetical protein
MDVEFPTQSHNHYVTQWQADDNQLRVGVVWCGVARGVTAGT